VWPVGRGVIIKRFGTQAHPDLSHVTIVNNGIDIKTETNARVNAVFEGEVVHIAFLSGYKNTVMINHGKYYTIYSNLESVAVSKGQKLKTGEMVGIAAVNADSGNTEVHFELWNKENPLNPAIWLKK
jgi:murein DD-endopeptidase MepM/ murein hydrolase activator NlpD